MKFKKVRSSLRALALAIFSIVASITIAAQNPVPKKTSFGGNFDSLQAEQRRLMTNWAAEYNKINGSKLTALRAYNALPSSFRTTFDAVSHALYTTQLTNDQGQPIGRAIDLVEMVEAIHGQVRKTSGDKQFRLYVLLKKGAVQKLFDSREFKRIGDNTIFHKGYPVNFRQQGGAPSIQFSITRTGRRADIDVDYRSSAFYAALFNGHLTAANSDVRAGNNYDRHVERWIGFRNWWLNLVDRLFIDDRRQADPAAEGVPETPRVTTSKGVEEAVRDFYQSWLVDQRPTDSLAYISVKSFPCVVEFHDGAQADSPLVQARILKQMRTLNESLGKVTKLSDVLQPEVIGTPGAKATRNPYATIFSLEKIPDEMAYESDCRIMLKMKLVEDLPKPGKGISDYYASMSRIKAGRSAEMTLFQVWSKEGNDWKVVSWHYDNPFASVKSPLLLKRDGGDEPVSGGGARSTYQPAPTADAELAAQTKDFLVKWLIDRNLGSTIDRLTPAAIKCATEELGLHVSNERDAQRRAREFFDRIAKEAGNGRELESVIISMDPSHEHVQSLAHGESNAYLLARVSDDLATMFSCDSRLAGTRFSPSHATGVPTFNTNTYETVFRLKRGGEQAAAFSMLWQKQGSEWKITAFDILTH